MTTFNTTNSNDYIHKTTIILRESKDYDNWEFLVKEMALSMNVWELCDPLLEENQRRPARKEPIEPTPTDALTPARQQSIGADASLSQLSEKELAVYDRLMSKYNKDETRYMKEREGLQKVNSFVANTIAIQHLPLIKRLNTPYERIQKLRKQFCPTDLARRRTVAERYNRAKQYQHRQAPEAWIETYQRAHAEAIELGLPEVSDNRPQQDLIAAVRSIYSELAGAWQVKLTDQQQSGTTITSFNDLVTGFLDYHRNIGPGTLPFVYGAHATMQNHEPPPTLDPDRRKPCLCGKTHAFFRCYYRNPSLAPSGWKEDPFIRQKIDEQCNGNEKLKAAWDKAQKINQDQTDDSVIDIPDKPLSYPERTLWD
jgi:hypothetical protein